jgi:hypothetical protein
MYIFYLVPSDMITLASASLGEVGIEIHILDRRTHTGVIPPPRIVGNGEESVIERGILTTFTIFDC